MMQAARMEQIAAVFITLDVIEASSMKHKW
jgi:hypothetical protein